MNKTIGRSSEMSGLRQSYGVVPLIIGLFALLLSYVSPRPLLFLTAWSLGQWLPVSSIRRSLNRACWKYWEDYQQQQQHDYGVEDIPSINVQEHLEDLLLHIETAYGKDWRKRPLLMKGLWSQDSLNEKGRRLSLQGLLQEDLEIPYFYDARRVGLLTPDRQAPVKTIVQNITRGAPHKIGTQLILQKYPELIHEVAPLHIVTELFGPFFSSEAIIGTGPFHALPALTTVPVFVAGGKSHPTHVERPHTALHCEPIGNIAVQLSGKKKWILIRPEFSQRLMPSVSPDGRAFFASWAAEPSHLAPSYEVVTEAGDALWVPVWTWHKVEYIESKDVALGASLFHFRPIDFWKNNPHYALLIIPAMLMEVIGFKKQ